MPTTLTSPFFVNNSLIKQIRAFYPLGIFSKNDFRWRVLKGQKFFLVRVKQKKSEFDCEIDGFILKDFTPYYGPKTDYQDSDIFVGECFEEGDMKGQIVKDLTDHLFQGYNAVFVVSPGERTSYALDKAKEYRKRLEKNWDKL